MERTNRWSVHTCLVCVGTHATFCPSHIPQTASSGLPPAFLSPFCSLFLLWLWKVTPHLRRRKFSISNHRSVLQKLQFWLLRSRFCLHSPEQPGALGQSPNLKEKCQTFRTVILLNDINTHSKRISLFLPLKACICFPHWTRESINPTYLFSP